MNLGNVRVLTGQVLEVEEVIKGWREDSFEVVRMAGIRSAGEGIERICQHHVNFLHIPHVRYHRIIVFEKQRDTRNALRECGGINRFQGWWCQSLDSRGRFETTENSLEGHCGVQIFALSLWYSL